HELRIDAKCAAEGRLHLFGFVVSNTEYTRRRRDQVIEDRRVGGRGPTDYVTLPGHLTTALSRPDCPLAKRCHDPRQRMVRSRPPFTPANQAAAAFQLDPTAPNARPRDPRRHGR